MIDRLGRMHVAADALRSAATSVEAAIEPPRRWFGLRAAATPDLAGPHRQAVDAAALLRSMDGWGGVAHETMRGVQLIGTDLPGAVSALRSIADGVDGLHALGIHDGTTALRAADRLRALPTWEWSAADAVAAGHLGDNLPVPMAEAAGVRGFDARIVKNEFAQARLDELIADGSMPATTDLFGARGARVASIVWSDATAEGVRARLVELSSKRADELTPDEWGELNALAFDVPESLRPPELVPYPLTFSDHIDPGAVSTQVYMPGFGEVTSGVGGSSRDFDARASQAFMLLGSMPRSAQREEFVLELATNEGSRVKEAIRFALDPSYADEVAQDLRRVLAEPTRLTAESTPHSNAAIGRVAAQVVDEVTGVERAIRAARLAEVVHPAPQFSRPLWAAIQAEAASGAFDASPQLAAQVSEIATLNLGRIDGTVANEEWWLKIADYSDLGRVQSLLELGRHLDVPAAPATTVAAAAGAATPAPPAGTIAW